MLALPPVLSVLVLTSLFAAAPLPADSATGAVQDGKPRVRATLISDVTQVEPGGRLRLGVRFEIDRGWHIYWKNPGEAGLPSEVVWDAPHIALGPMRWPAPKVIRSPDGSITSYGYSGEVVLFVEGHIAPGAQGPLPVVATADVLVCEVQCIPAKLELTRFLSTGPRVPDEAGARLLDASAARVPRPADALGLRLAARRTSPFEPGKPFDGELTVEHADGSPVRLASDGAFVPDRVPGVLSIVGTLTGSGRLEVWGKAASDPSAQPLRLQGVVALADGQSAEVDLPFDAAPGASLRPAAAAPPAPSRTPALPLVLLLAFLGGVLLNAMPCVFPVLALKAYGFTRTVHGDHGSVRAHALAYTLGIVVSLLTLAVAVLALRATGHAVGWGFQFQEPLFVGLLTTVVVIFALSLFGLFELNVSAGANRLTSAVDQRHGALRSVGEGVLAVVLATPCSAPLLGTAVGFAFAASAPVVLVVFAFVGLGLAAPFCALVLFPRIGERLPRPGDWMERGKQLLGFALLGTAVWLLSILGGLAGADGVVRLLLLLLAVSLAAWAWRVWRRPAVLTLGALGLVAVAWFTLRFSPPVKEGLVRKDAWSEEAVASALAEGRPVFVDFTADWCLSCKFNERTVLESYRVRSALARTRARVLVADWTRRDARIAEELETHGRAGVPLYLVYGPARPDSPEVLPELLTPERVVTALEQAALTSGQLGLSTPTHVTR
jgi:thiol:disulfide interchange protein/DsbC/DsbD-like thiol-disulfide interchange protein